MKIIKYLVACITTVGVVAFIKEDSGSEMVFMVLLCAIFIQTLPNYDKKKDKKQCVNCEHEAIDKGNWRCSKQVCDINVLVDEKL